MKRTTMQRGGTSPEWRDRLRAVKDLLEDRNASNYISVFAACGEQFTNKERDMIREIWNGQRRVRSNHAALIQRMERAVAHLPQPQHAA